MKAEIVVIKGWKNKKRRTKKINDKRSEEKGRENMRGKERKSKEKVGYWRKGENGEKNRVKERRANKAK